MIVEPVVTARQIDGRSAELGLLIPFELEWFKGHFPGAPVVPGVVQIKWALELAARCLPVNGIFSGMEALKFQRVMTPGLAVTLSLDWTAESGKLRFAYQGDGARYSSGRLVLRPRP